MKCSLCDGPVVNGRCTLCGMPFHSDAILYHPNERPSEHYKHANAKSKAIMRRQHASAGPAALGKNATKADIQKHQEQVRQDAVKRMTTTKSPVHTGSPSSGQNIKKKKRTSRIILAILIIWIIVMNFVPKVLDEIIDRNYSNTYSDTYTDTGSSEEYTYDPYFYEGSSDNVTYYMLAAGKDSVSVGEEIVPGSYSVWTAEDSITLLLKTGEKTSTYNLKSGNSDLPLTLHEGDSLSLTNAEDDDSCIYLDQVSSQNTDSISS